MTVAWNNKRELTLLKHYQAEPILWQFKHNPKNKNKVHRAWMRISAIMNIPVPDLKKKRDSLMSSYRAYKKKVKDSARSGGGSGAAYKPIWFAYETLESFLGEGARRNKVIKIEESSSMYANEKEKGTSDMNVDNQRTVPQTIRRSENPPELLTVGEVVNDVLPTLKRTLNTEETEDDECDLHGKIIAKKLRKLPENERMQFVCEIYNMFMRRDNLR